MMQITLRTALRFNLFRRTASVVAVGITLLLLKLGAAAQATDPQAPVFSEHFMQWTAGDSGAATFDTTRFGKPVVSGNMILVLAHWNDQDITATITDSRSNKYLPLVQPLNAGRTERFQAWYARNVKGGAEVSVTINFSKKTRSFSVIDAIEYAGLDKASPLIAAVSAVGSGNTQSSGPIAATGAQGCLLIGLFGYSNYALPYKAGQDFTMRAYEASTMIEDSDCSAGGVDTAIAISSNAADWAAIGAAFRKAL